MKIECILRRAGGTMIDLGGSRYHFKPEPSDEAGPHIADVSDPVHAKQLLAIKEGYRKASGEADDSDGVVAQTNDAGALVLTVPQPPAEADLIEVLTALGAANPKDLLGAIWPDRFPPKKVATKASEPSTAKQATPAAAPAQAFVTGLTITAAAAPAETAGGAAGAVPTPALPLGVPLGAMAAPADSETGNAGGEGGEELENRFASLDDAALRVEFERVIGRKPHSNAKRETMIAQMVAKISGE